MVKPHSRHNRTWRWLGVVFIVAWALRELYPLNDRDLIAEFQNQAAHSDAKLDAIVTQARALQKARPERVFGDLLEAIGTNDITPYFPSIEVAEQDSPTRVILDRLQRKAAGKLKLGLDLWGGTSFLVEMDTNRLSSTGQNESRQRALSPAVEVLRKRVDRLGVAEPLLQPVGENRILIALPGLSDADTESARRQIQKAAFLEFRVVHPDSAKLIADGIPAPGYEILTLKTRKSDARAGAAYLVKKGAERGLTGAYVKSAGVARQTVSNEPEIYLNFNDEGRVKFGEITTEFRPQGGRG